MGDRCPSIMSVRLMYTFCKTIQSFNLWRSRVFVPWNVRKLNFNLYTCQKQRANSIFLWEIREKVTRSETVLVGIAIKCSIVDINISWVISCTGMYWIVLILYKHWTVLNLIYFAFTLRTAVQLELENHHTCTIVFKPICIALEVLSRYVSAKLSLDCF